MLTTFWLKNLQDGGMDIIEIVWKVEYLSFVAQDRGHCRALVQMAMKLRAP
jgi:hypothetical protein